MAAEAEVAVPSFARTALPGRVVFGEGAIRHLADEVGVFGLRAFLIVDPRESTMARAAGAVLGDQLVATWDDVRQHVPVELAERARAAVVESGADVLVCVGGGSTTGLGKAVAVTTGLPLAVVPTTYAGSEMTPIYGLTANREKRTATDMTALPKLVVYDPELVLTLPSEVVGMSGMNALAHCVEALWAPRHDPIADVLGLEGTRLLAQHLPAACAFARTAERGQVQVAACLAGTVLATAGASIHHALCHLLGGLYDLPHAETHAVLLPHAMRFAVADAPAILDRLADAVDCHSRDVPGAIWELGASVGTPDGLAALGLTKAQADEAAHVAVERTITSPRPLSAGDASKILDDAWRGRRPEPLPVQIGGSDG